MLTPQLLSRAYGYEARVLAHPQTGRPVVLPDYDLATMLEEGTMTALAGTIARIGPLDEAALAQAREREATLTKPPGSLGRLEDLAVQLAGITGSARPIRRAQGDRRHGR